MNPTSSAITSADALCIFRRALFLASCLDATLPPNDPTQEVRLIQVSGNNQGGQPGEILPEPLVVRLEDQFGRPVAGAEVTAEIIQGGAEFVPPPSFQAQTRSTFALPSQAGNGTIATALTDAQGEARFFLRLGFTDDLVVTQVSAFDQAVEFLIISGFESPEEIAIEADGSIVVADGFVQAVIRVDPVSGERSVVSACPLLRRGTFFSIVVEASGTLLTLNASNGIVRVNPHSGDCILISGTEFHIPGPGIGSGPSFQSVADMALEANGSLVVVDNGLDAVIRVDPVSGDRSIISARTRGIGPNFISPFDIVVEPTGQLVVADANLGALVRVDPASGNRTILAGCMDIECSIVRGESAGSCIFGDGLGFSPMAVESDGSLVVGGAAWVRVDAVTGDRTLISDSCIPPRRGSGPSVNGVVLRSKQTVPW